MTKTLTQLQEEYDADTKIDATELGNEALRIPRLHQKWLRYLNEYKVKAFMNRKKIDEMASLRQRYYNGELSATTLAERGWEPWNLKHKVKAEMERWLDGDAILRPMREKQFAFEVCMEHCEEVLKGLRDQHHAVRHSIDWQKFTSGN